jgi:hypothetical protein
MGGRIEVDYLSPVVEQYNEAVQNIEPEVESTEQLQRISSLCSKCRDLKDGCDFQYGQVSQRGVRTQPRLSWPPMVE